MKNEELIDIANRAFLANYRQAPIVLVEGKGCRVKDADGRSYLDLCAGIAVVSVGHGHPRLARAIFEQASRLMHTSNLFFNQRSIELADRAAAAHRLRALLLLQQRRRGERGAAQAGAALSIRPRREAAHRDRGRASTASTAARWAR